MYYLYYCIYISIPTPPRRTYLEGYLITQQTCVPTSQLDYIFKSLEKMIAQAADTRRNVSPGENFGVWPSQGVEAGGEEGLATCDNVVKEINQWALCQPSMRITRKSSYTYLAFFLISHLIPYPYHLPSS